MHKGIKDHACPWSNCMWRTNEPSNLKRHLLTHTGLRPHKCPHCTYAASQASPPRLSTPIIHTCNCAVHLRAVNLSVPCPDSWVLR